MSPIQRASSAIESRPRIQLAEKPNFLISREDIIQLVRRHTFAHDRVNAGCEYLNRLGNLMPMSRHG
jgi:hypothetical protein